MVKVPSDVSTHFTLRPQLPLATTSVSAAQAVSTMPSGTALSSMRAANRMDRIRFFTEIPLFFVISAGTHTGGSLQRNDTPVFVRFQ